MLKVTKIDGSKILVNEDWIEFIEEAPDTILSFNSGRKMAVNEKIDTIIELISANKMKNITK